jgi:hypothetical protein
MGTGKGSGRGGTRVGAGRKPGNLTVAIRSLTMRGLQGIVTRLNFLEKRISEEGCDAARKEHASLSIRAAELGLPHALPRLQAVMQQTTIETGDTLKSLLKEIDGSTTGIATGADSEPEVAIKQPLLLPN